LYVNVNLNKVNVYILKKEVFSHGRREKGNCQKGRKSDYRNRLKKEKVVWAKIHEFFDDGGVYCNPDRDCSHSRYRGDVDEEIGG